MIREKIRLMIRKNVTSIGEIHKLRKAVERIEILLNKIIEDDTSRI